jgi:hypothetical protein
MGAVRGSKKRDQGDIGRGRHLVCRLEVYVDSFRHAEGVFPEEEQGTQHVGKAVHHLHLVVRFPLKFDLECTRDSRSLKNSARQGLHANSYISATGLSHAARGSRVLKRGSCGAP